MPEKKITKRQHYVPQIYLKSFSSDKKCLWSYPLNQMENGKSVPIRSVCFENYLYEICNNDGKPEVTNWIENVLSQLEGTFSTKLRELERKAFHQENYKKKCFLTTQEKLFWKLYIAVQITRSPIILEVTRTVAKAQFGGQLNDNQINNLALLLCLPFFGKLKAEDKNAFNLILRPLENMSISVGVDESGTLFTSDNPVYCYTPDREDLTKIEEYEKIVVPLTPNLVLLMFGGELAKEYDRNRLFPLDDEAQESIRLSIAYSASLPAEIEARKKQYEYYRDKLLTFKELKA